MLEVKLVTPPCKAYTYWNIFPVHYIGIIACHLLNWLILDFLVKVLEFSMYNISFAHNKSFNSLFSICIPLLFWHRHTIIVSKSDESQYTCFILDVKLFHFSLLSIILAVSLPYVVFILPYEIMFFNSLSGLAFDKVWNHDVFILSKRKETR